MKRKSITIGICALVFLAAGFLFSGRNGKKRAAAQNPVVITQDGRLTIVPPESRAVMTIVADKSKLATNAPAFTTSTNR